MWASCPQGYEKNTCLKCSIALFEGARVLGQPPYGCYRRMHRCCGKYVACSCLCTHAHLFAEADAYLLSLPPQTLAAGGMESPCSSARGTASPCSCQRALRGASVRAAPCSRRGDRRGDAQLSRHAPPHRETRRRKQSDSAARAAVPMCQTNPRRLATRHVRL